jgi:hypothetical protein
MLPAPADHASAPADHAVASEDRTGRPYPTLPRVAAEGPRSPQGQY